MRASCPGFSEGNLRKLPEKSSYVILMNADAKSVGYFFIIIRQKLLTEFILTPPLNEQLTQKDCMIYIIFRLIADGEDTWMKKLSRIFTVRM